MTTETVADRGSSMKAKEFEAKYIHADKMIARATYPTSHGYDSVNVDAVIELLNNALDDPDIDYDFSKLCNYQTHISTKLGVNKVAHTTNKLYIYTTDGTLEVCFRTDDGVSRHEYISLRHNHSKNIVYLTRMHPVKVDLVFTKAFAFILKLLADN